MYRKKSFIDFRLNVQNYKFDYWLRKLSSVLSRPSLLSTFATRFLANTICNLIQVDINMYIVKCIGSIFIVRIHSILLWLAIFFIVVSVLEDKFVITDFVSGALIFSVICSTVSRTIACIPPFKSIAPTKNKLKLDCLLKFYLE